MKTTESRNVKNQTKLLAKLGDKTVQTCVAQKLLDTKLTSFGKMAITWYTRTQINETSVKMSTRNRSTKLVF